jgi:hypothetical protein
MARRRSRRLELDQFWSEQPALASALFRKREKGLPRAKTRGRSAAAGLMRAFAAIRSSRNHSPPISDRDPSPAVRVIAGSRVSRRTSSRMTRAWPLLGRSGSCGAGRASWAATRAKRSCARTLPPGVIDELRHRRLKIDDAPLAVVLLHGDLFARRRNGRRACARVSATRADCRTSGA